MRAALPVLVLALFACLLPGHVSSDAPAEDAPVYVLSLNAKTGATAMDWVSDGLEKAVADGAQLLLLELSTPGGPDIFVREIARMIEASPVPVVVYVTPSGGRVAGAGLYLIYAAHLVVMAPDTSLQAGPAAFGDREGAEKAVDELMELGLLRGRNAEWLMPAAQRAVSISVAEALKTDAVDLITESRDFLLQHLDGYELQAADRSVRLATASAPLVDLGKAPEPVRELYDPSILILVFSLVLVVLFLMVVFGPVGWTLPIVLGLLLLYLLGDLSWRALSEPDTAESSSVSQPEVSQVAPDSSRPAAVYVAPFEMIIGPASVAWLEESLELAHEGGGQLLVLKLNTPGGLSTSMRTMIEAILTSEVPVAVYVAPSGAHAASAGTYLLYAAHIAAMAPATNIGAATPVMMQADTGGAKEDDSKKDKQEDGAEGNNLKLMRKIENDAVAQIKGLAELRGRNIEWAEKAVREAVTATDTEALELGIIEFRAASVEELIKDLNGYRLMIDDAEVTLHTDTAPLVELQPGIRIRLLSHVASPQIAGTLFSLGMALIPLEFVAGAGGFAALLGLVLILIGAYGLSLLPLAYSGLALLAFGGMLMLLDVTMIFSGLLFFAGGAIAGFGGFMVYDLDFSYEGMGDTVLLVVLLLVVTATVLFAVLASRRARTRSGAESMLGETVEVLQDFSSTGWVMVQGERWKGCIEGGAGRGERLYIEGISGLMLQLSRQKTSGTDSEEASPLKGVESAQ